MGLLIIAMDRIEDRMNGEASPRPARRVRHLRLVHGEGHGGRHRASVSEHDSEAA
ncbi:hypothetical protein ACFQ0X_03625 [Streptomyces rectiviolaceus]